ncbi:MULTISPECIES: flagellar basal body rod protein FlgF [Corallincola]|uniref:Flagellar basal-body rod protein FlgF n=3 Tax=Corallincola TaxID=1775176 RepID=A0A368N3F3_9GAMM|nr:MULTISPECIES: flagellar basal body rod protein FlgF [Corallincola]RCU44593.1 flagellar basal body rod protein FlgF [Corallincola holothuriorum]TAA40338.1 flagellar basal body rod protein FlgF [Corallincola spongiicola]TCI05355.1 flagellar basal body rod protein FlgF [Corallincola luteus]
MDRFMYLAMSGAKQNFHSIGVHANNLANANTTGFKADLEQSRAMQAFGEGLPTRVFAMTENPASSLRGGALVTTGRSLDVAVKGDGWLAVADGQGQEAYTRAGDLVVSPEGLLTNGSGRAILGDDGAPIVVPQPYAKIEIGGDGTISVLPTGAPPTAVAAVGRIKLVQPDKQALDKGLDGLFRLKGDAAALGDTLAPANADITLMSGVLEGSNVSAVSEMTSMLSLQRQFEMQIKMMRTAEDIDKSSDQLLRLG